MNALQIRLQEVFRVLEVSNDAVSRERASNMLGIYLRGYRAMPLSQSSAELFELLKTYFWRELESLPKN